MRRSSALNGTAVGLVGGSASPNGSIVGSPTVLIPPPRPNVPRFAPDLPFPPYTYVSGHAPHPLSSPEGHRFAGVADALQRARDADDLTFRYALDLFNHGYYWESHEQWERLWHHAGRSGPQADFLKGLIKLSAAAVKAREGRFEGSLRHLRRAVELLQLSARSLAGPGSPDPRFHGFHPLELAVRAEQLASTFAKPPAKSDPTRLLDLVLIPERGDFDPGD